MAIVPDTKDWTWVLKRRCPECGFDASAVAFSDVPDLIRANVAAWPAVLRRDDVRERPDDSTWSPLEYAAHVRDVFERFSARLAQLLHEDDPEFENWDQDAAAVAGRYAELDPAEVAAQLERNGLALADAFEAVPPDSTGRTGRRSDGAVFTVESLSRYLIHDPVHHLWDVGARRP